MPGPARIGMALLIFGAILVGYGTYSETERLTVFGFIVVTCGFVLYMASSYYARKMAKR